ncbi:MULTISPECIES: hypothetical protein [unclassified Bradyrhizobium]|uniref:hypothetical protein n=1 Tax=unclassified Bradyrhizobium TaxID=2631580 RepID=UPI001FFAACA4|nr:MULTISPECIES: hypothetical protein [unclassified Bradyrhizobium]MCK1708584.1 hypothetical protein [Bradyrhizobium sp. 143]MCK1731175.1 hypothetical protein [Bradyrhizobium sp. 142]
MCLLSIRRDVGFGDLGIADFTGFMNFSRVGDDITQIEFQILKLYKPIVSMPGDVATGLRGIVLVGEPPLRLGLDEGDADTIARHAPPDRHGRPADAVPAGREVAAAGRE